MTACAVAFLGLACSGSRSGGRTRGPGGVRDGRVRIVGPAAVAAVDCRRRRPRAAPGRGVSAFAVLTREGASRCCWWIGASLDIISPAAADGASAERRPHPRRTVRRCTWRRSGLRSPRRSDGNGHGKASAAKNGVRSAATVPGRGRRRPTGIAAGLLLCARLVSAGLFDETTQTSAALRAGPLWAI